MAADYRDRIAARVEHLRSTPGFTVLTCEIAPPVSPAALDRATEVACGRLPAGVEAFCTQINGFRLEWEYREPGTGAGVSGAHGADGASGVDGVDGASGVDGADGGPTDTGSVNVLPVERIFSDWRGTTWFDNSAGGGRFALVKPFDLYVPEACAAFCQSQDGPPGDETYFHYFGEDLEPLGLSFEEYLDLTLVTCGYLNWRIALSRDDPRQPQGQPTLERMCAIIPGFSEDQLPSGP